MAGAACCDNPPALNPSSGAGSVVDDLGGLKAYTAGSPDSKAAVVLISDVFGYEAPNLRKLADKVAAAGFFVVVPDFFEGDPFVPDDPARPIMTWIQEHLPVKSFAEAKAVVEALNSKGISAVGAAGFCWGGKVVVELAKANLIKAAVMLHPSMISIDDIKDVKCHISILGAEIDQITPPSLTKQFEEILSAKTEVNSYVEIFPGVAHGWTVRYETNDEQAVNKAEDAHGKMLSWFVKHL